MKRLSKYQIASCLFMLAFVLGTAAVAEAREMTFWETFLAGVDVVIMMCPVRHPFALLGWHGAHTVAASFAQWGGIAAAGAIVAVWRRR